jgi:DNA polymerase III epsilon subunit-like protein
LLSIGACLVTDPQRTFYVELQPVNDNALPEALAISGLALNELAKRGLPPTEALTRFEGWLTEVIPSDQQPVFAAFNAPFDWMFVNDYFHRFLGRNPFGHAALDLKAFYMGLTGVHWSETGMRNVAARYSSGRQLTHHALRDAQDQADLFQEMLAEAAARGRQIY